MQINSYHFFLRLKHKFARTQDTDHLLWALEFLHLHWCRANLYSIHQEFAWIDFIKTAVCFPLWRGLENKRTEILTNIHWSLWLLHWAKGNESIFVFDELFCGFGVKLLMLYDSILSDSKIFLNFFMKCWLFLLCEFWGSMHDIFISNFDDVLFIFIDDTK